MNVYPVLAVVAMAGLSCAEPAEAQDALPHFEAFAVVDSFDREPAPVVLSSPRARRFRTVLADAAKRGPNFAGHYRVATWGCGSDCHAVAIIDAATGAVHFAPDVLWIGGLPGNDEERIQFRKNSRLLVLVGSRNDKGGGRYYYEWTGTQLRLVLAAAAP